MEKDIELPLFISDNYTIERKIDFNFYLARNNNDNKACFLHFIEKPINKEVHQKLQHPLFNQIQNVFKLSDNTFLISSNALSDKNVLQLLSQEGSNKELILVKATIQIALALIYLDEQGLQFKDQQQIIDFKSIFSTEQNDFLIESSQILNYLQLKHSEDEHDQINTVVAKIPFNLLVDQLSLIFLNEDKCSQQQLKEKVLGIKQDDSRLLQALKYFYSHLESLQGQAIVSKLREVESQILSNQDQKTYVEDTTEEMGDDFIPNTLTQIFSSMSFGGFTGKDFINHQNKMIEELQIIKYNLSQGKLDKQEQLLQIQQIVRQNILRCTFDLCEKQSKERINLIEQNERDKYLETISTYVETLRWISSDFKQRAIDMLDLLKHFTQREIQNELSLDCIDKGSSYFTSADQQVLQIFRDDKNGLMANVKIPQWVDSSLIMSIAKYFKLQFMKAMENPDKEIDDSKMLEESVKLEDEILHVFRINRVTLSKAIIDYQLEDQFQL